MGREQADLGVGGGRDELGQRHGVEVRLVAMASGGELCSISACTEEEGEERDGTGRFQGARDDKDGARMTRIAGARSPTRGRARRRPARRYGRRRPHSAEQGETVTKLNDLTRF